MAAPDPADGRGAGRAGAPVRRGVPIVLGSAMVLALAAAVWLMVDPPHRAGNPSARRDVDPTYAQYVGDAVCRDCHPGPYAAHTRSGHSRTLRRAGPVAQRRGWDGITAADPERPGVVWTFRLSDGRLWLERLVTPSGKSGSEPGPPSAARAAAERFVVDYAFGSGQHATTLVSMVDRDPRHPTLREHRMTVFAHSAVPGLTLGQSLTGHASGNTETGRIHSSDNTLRCFACHATVTSDRGPDVLDESTMIPDVTCERCHGPARSHVAAARRGASAGSLRMPFGLESATIDQQLALCGGCHRIPEMVASGVRIENPSIVRHQPVGLMQSACFKKSDRAIGCTTCHDPHARPSTDQAAYEATCRSCHAERHVAPCPVSARDGCVGCHMPRRDVGRGMIMTDHWIRIVAPGEPHAAR